MLLLLLLLLLWLLLFVVVQYGTVGVQGPSFALHPGHPGHPGHGGHPQLPPGMRYPFPPAGLPSSEELSRQHVLEMLQHQHPHAYPAWPPSAPGRSFFFLFHFFGNWMTKM